jgi:hypothetical protein
MGLLAALGVMALVGCGGGGDSAEDLVAGSVEQMRAVESFRSETVSDIDSFGVEFQSVQRLEVAGGRDFSTVFKIGEAPTSQLMVVDGFVYAEVPVTGWVRTTLAEAVSVGGTPAQWLLDPAGFYGIVFSGEDIPWSLYAITEVGSGTVAGVNATHFEITFDVGEVAARLTGQPQALVEALAGGSEAEEVPFTFEVWIDDEGYTRRLVMEVADERFGTTRTDVKMWDFDEQITVIPPTAFTDLN